MSYLNRRVDTRTRTRAVLSVAGIHAVIGVTLVIGLTYTGVIPPPVPNPTATTFTPLPDPLPAPTQTPVNGATLPTTTTPDRPDMTTDVWERDSTQHGPVFDDPPERTPPAIPTPTAMPTLSAAPPSPTPSFAAAGPRPLNGPAGWITDADYPSLQIRRAEEGTTLYRLVIGSDGEVNACEITGSSGSTGLDRATCRLLERRARFAPASDGNGASVVGTYSGSVTWRLPD